MDRTIKVQLHPTPEQATALSETVAQFTHAYNMVCEYGWNTREKNGVTLHHAMYYDTKASCPTLVSDLLIQARVKATETLKSAFTWEVKHKAKHRKRVEKAGSRASPNLVSIPSSVRVVARVRHGTTCIPTPSIGQNRLSDSLQPLASKL